MQRKTGAPVYKTTTVLSGVETHPQYAFGDGSFTSPPRGLAVSYDLINLVKKLYKVRKNPERALHVVRSDLANFFGFHRFGIKEFAVVQTAHWYNAEIS